MPTTQSYNLMLVGDQGEPNPAIIVGVWLSNQNPNASPQPKPLFTVTVPVAPTDSDATIITNVHGAVDAVLTQADSDLALHARANGYIGQVMPHTHTVAGT